MIRWLTDWAIDWIIVDWLIEWLIGDLINSNLVDSWAVSDWICILVYDSLV